MTDWALWLSVQRAAVLHGLGHMRHLGVLRARQISDGAGHLEGTVRGAGRPSQPGGGRLQKLQRGGLQQGKPEQIDMAQKGRWLSDDCGAIKPMPTGR